MKFQLVTSIWSTLTSFTTLLVVITALFLSHLMEAATTTKESGPAIKAVVVKPGYEKNAKKRFNQKKFKVINAANYSQKKTRFLPSLTKRDRHLKRAGLSMQLINRDELYKDELYLRAGELTLDELAQKYPKISRQKLDHLQRIVK